jgi:ATP phosphoribosyltransferase regulatory subunit
MQQSTWFTPEGLEDLLPPQAQKLEFYRRKLMDGFHLSGYDLVLPPLAEFTDSLLTGTAGHMAVDTCRFTDQESGRMMGVRSDMTPQVARIVSNRLKADSGISRLCYVGEVLKTRNNKAKGSRSPIQVGAELFGHQGVESDIEIIELMLQSMNSLGLAEIKVSLGHVEIVNELMALAQLDAKKRSEMIDILERKAIPEYEAFLADSEIPADLSGAFKGLLTLCGDAQTVMTEAKKQLGNISSVLDNALGHLESVVAYLAATQDGEIHVDVADMRGYQYHTGIIFACYSAGGPLQPIATGGRYDNIGSVFGLALPATGFSIDLRTALDRLAEVETSEKGSVHAPNLADKALLAKVVELKAEGYQVVKSYDLNTLASGELKLVESNGEWSVEVV